MRKAALAIAVLLTASPAFAQLPGGLGKLTKAKETADKVQGLKISEEDERKIGEQVSEKVRDTFGVYQDAAVTKYVTLVGTVLAQASSRPNLKWEFIVLDTEGVNAFAAPGGIVHITKGLLGLTKNEAELAGALGHEITHITAKHTVNSIQKSNAFSAAASASGKGGGLTQDILTRIVEEAYKNILNNKFDRNDENEADKVGVELANKIGYAPNGLVSVLTKIAERNNDRQEPNGLFASHPEIKDRIAKITGVIESEKLTATATVAERYTKNITFDAKPAASITTVAEGSRGLAGSSGDDGDKNKKDGEKTEKTDKKEEKKGGFLGKFTPSSGKEAKNTQTVSSAGVRGINPDRDAIGGSNKSKVPVTVTAAEITTFKSGIA
jgi:predicted Zn-dependent protease